MWISRTIFGFYSQLVFTVYTPLTVVGREKIPQDTGIIFASNHNSHSDTAIIAVGSGLKFNRLAMLAASDYWFDNLFRRFLFNLLLHLIPVDRGKSQSHKKISLEQTLGFCRKFTGQKNRGIVMYPEGTRSTTGKIQSLKDGVSLFALRLNVPIVPVYIRGSFKTWPKGKFFIRPGKLIIEFLDPIYLDQVESEYRKIFFDNSKEELSKIKKLTELLNHRLLLAEKKYA